MKRLIVPLSLAFALAIGATAATAESREERLAAAREYLQQTAQDIDMEMVIRQMWMPLVRKVEASGKTVSDEQKQKLDALYQETFAGPLREIMLGQDETMADIFTLEEITTLRDFYLSPVGRSVMRKLPQLMQRQQPQIIAFMQSRMPDLMPQVQKILGLR